MKLLLDHGAIVEDLAEDGRESSEAMILAWPGCRGYVAPTWSSIKTTIIMYVSRLSFGSYLRLPKIMSKRPAYSPCTALLESQQQHLPSNLTLLSVNSGSRSPGAAAYHHVPMALRFISPVRRGGKGCWISDERFEKIGLDWIDLDYADQGASE